MPENPNMERVKTSCEGLSKLFNEKKLRKWDFDVDKVGNSLVFRIFAPESEMPGIIDSITGHLQTLGE